MIAVATAGLALDPRPSTRVRQRRRIASSVEYSAIHEAWQGLSKNPNVVAGKVHQEAYTAAITA
jgi:hypothetical protein